jgi:pSer/pThr/pTyr-binding forkhead associated (FHA) protein
LAPGQRIRIGPYRIELAASISGNRTTAGGDSKLLLARCAEGDDLPRVTLEFLNAALPAKRSNHTWQLDRALTFVGQATECKVRLTDTSVSAFHCSLLRTRHGVWMVDLLSRNGTLLNGKALRWGLLRDRDELKVGTFLIRFHYDQVPAAPSTATAASAPTSTGPNRSRAAERDDNKATWTRPETDPLPFVEPIEPRTALVANGATSSAEAARATEEMLNSIAATPVPTGADFWQSMVGPLFNQFSLMQQNMFDQFQKSLLMVVQVLNSQQKTQFDLVRDELDSLRKLNVELASLQAELVRHQQGGISGAPRDDADRRQHSRARARETWVDAPESATAARGFATGPAAAQASSEKLNSADELRSAKDPDVPGTASTVAPSTYAGSAGAANDAHDPGEALQDSDLVADDTATLPPEDVHKLITERLQALQAERLSLWQKILKKIVG